MHFEPGGVYHIYNRSIGDEKIFQNSDHYHFFLEKIRKEWLPYCEILGYCLMPAHFHFEVIVNEDACEYLVLKDKLSNLQKLSKAIGKTLSSYTRAIQKQQGRRLNLFAKKTKAKLISDKTTPVVLQREYVMNAFRYIHQNPVKAEYCLNAEDWEMSSARDYAGVRKGSICNLKRIREITGLKEREVLELIGIRVRSKEVVYRCRGFLGGSLQVSVGLGSSLKSIRARGSEPTGQATVSGLTGEQDERDEGSKIMKNDPPSTDSPDPQALPRPPT